MNIKNRIGWLVLLLSSIISNLYMSRIYQDKIITLESNYIGCKQYLRKDRTKKETEKLIKYIESVNWRE